MNLNLNDYRLKIIFLFSLLTLIIKIMYNTSYIAIVTSTIFEFILLVTIFLLTDNKKTKYLFFIFYLMIISTLLIQAFYLNESLIRKESLPNLNSASIHFFFNEIVSMTTYIKYFLVIILLFVIPAIIPIKKEIKNLKKKNIILICLLLLLLIPQVGDKYFDNIYVNTIDQYLESRINSKIEVLDYAFLDEDFKRFDNSITNYSDIEIKNDSKEIILIFVMESVSNDIFYNTKLENNFFEKIENNSITYTNYYTNNQDSRTSIQTILSSRFIPNEAYESFLGWEEFYGDIVDKNNLVDFFNSKNYETVFAISSQEIPLESEKYNWNEYINVENYSKTGEEYLCLHLFDLQHGCEDKAIIEEVKAKINSSEKLFLMQEFVFGHGETYNARKKMTSFQYYNSYFNDIYSFLEKEKLLDKVTIIIVSDHGKREFIPSRKPEGYNIPLVIYSSNINSSINNTFLNHLYFKDLLFNQISKNYSFDLPEETFLVGPSHKGIIGYISPDNHYFLKDDTVPYVIEKSSKIKVEEIAQKLDLVKQYKDRGFN